MRSPVFVGQLKIKTDMKTDIYKDVVINAPTTDYLVAQML